MENGTEIVSESRWLDETTAEVGVFQERVEEKAVSGSDGLDEVEVEEVFEEAVELPERLDEQGGAKVDCGDQIVDGEEGNVLTVSDASLTGVTEISNGGDEVENFEEAIGIPDQIGDEVDKETRVTAKEKVQDFGGANGVEGDVVVGEIDGEKTVLEDVPFEVKVHGSDSFVVNKEDGVKEISEISVGGEIESKIAGGEVEKSSNLVIDTEKSESGNFDSVTSKNVAAGEKLDKEAASLECYQETESSKENKTEVSKVQEIEENTLGVEDRNVRIVYDDLNLKVHGEKGVQMDGDRQDLDSNQPKSGTSIDSVQSDYNVGPQSSIEHKDNQNGDVRMTPAEHSSELNAETSELKNTLANTVASIKERVPEIINSTSSEKSNVEKTEVIKAIDTDLQTVSHKAIQPEQVRDVHVVYDNGKAKEPEQREEKDKEEKHSTQVHSAVNQPAQENASLPGKSTNSAPSNAPPAGLGRAAPLLEPTPRVVQQPRVNGSVTQMQNQQIEEPVNGGDSEEYDETREKLQMIRVKFLRLAHRLGQTPHNVVVAQVLYRLGLAEQLRGRNGGRVGAFSFDRASAMAEQLEASGQEPLDFSCTIMVLGKSGVGKSATINSIFDEVKFGTDAFQMGTKKVQDVVGTVQGIKVRVIDTPGLLPSWSDQRQNERILHSVKRFIKKTPPDIVLYLDRLDMQCRDFSDMPLLRTITEIFGPSIWCNAIVVLTHAASAPPDGPNGTASSYDMFVTQRSHVVQQAIRQAAADMRLMNPVSLVENHSACRTNRAGQRVLPNGQVWKPHLLLLSFASKILAEANALLKLQDSPPGKPFANRRGHPLPFLLSSLLQSRPQLKLPEEQFGDDDDVYDDLDESSDSDDESEYDGLPPFKSLNNAQLAKLSKAQKKAYYDELEYREKLLMKKQLKEEKKRRKIMKKMAEAVKDLPRDLGESTEESSGGASIPVSMPDFVLPASFDSDSPTHRYRHLDSSNWLVRPVLETHGWDHDVGYEGINVEKLFVLKEKIPLSFSGQVSKDKKDANVQMEVASSLKHGEGKSTSLGFDMQTVGKDLVYTLRSETRFSNFRRNKATAGLSVTLLGDAVSAGVKLEDKLIANKQFQLVMAGGAMTSRGDIAYGGSLEAQLRDKDYPVGRWLSTLGLSVMDWHGDLALGLNVQSQIPVGRHTTMIARANVNNRGAGQVSIRLNSSEQFQLALAGLIPLIRKFITYTPQLSFGQ